MDGALLADALEDLADLIEAKKKTLKRTLQAAAFGTFLHDGTAASPTPIEPGDELYIQRNHEPGAGTISRNPAGKAFGRALGALAAGTHGRVKATVYEKRWVVDGNPCPICEQNGLAGWIPIDEPYPNDAEPGDVHPNCQCDEITREADEE